MQAERGSGNSRILSFRQVALRMQRHWALIVGLAARGLAHYKENVAAKLAKPSGRLRAAYIHDFMINELRRVHGDDVIQARGRSLLRVDQGIVVQFKKIDSRGRTRNIPTTAALQFETQLSLPGIPQGMRVTYGYRLNKANTDVVEESLVARDGDVIIWREAVREDQQLVIPLRVNRSQQKRNKMHAKPDAAEARGVNKPEQKSDEHGE